MQFKTFKICGSRYNPRDDFTHQLTKMYLELPNNSKVYCQKYKVSMNLFETIQLMLCEIYNKIQPTHKKETSQFKSNDFCHQ